MSHKGTKSERSQASNNILNLREKRNSHELKQRANFPHAAESRNETPAPAIPPLMLNVCYVDNNADRATRVESALGQFGHTVKSCLRAEDALKTLSMSSVDMIVLGPIGAVGTVLVTAIRRAKWGNVSALPLVVLSTDESFDKDCELMNYGANLVLPTTITAEQLNSRIKELFFYDNDDAGITEGARLNICLLEDTALADGKLRHAMASTGSAVDVFFAIADVIHATEEYQYDAIIISERHFNGARGAKAVRLIRDRLMHRGQTIPILALTTNASPANISALFAAGADDVKPQPVYFDLYTHLQLLIRDTKNALPRTKVQDHHTPAAAEPNIPRGTANLADRIPHAATTPPFTFPLPNRGHDEAAGFEAFRYSEMTPPNPESADPFGNTLHAIDQSHHEALQANMAYSAGNHAAAIGHDTSHHGHNPPSHDPFRADHDPLAGFFKRFVVAANRFHGQEA